MANSKYSCVILKIESHILLTGVINFCQLLFLFDGSLQQQEKNVIYDSKEVKVL